VVGIEFPGLSRTGREVASLSAGWEYNLTNSEANLSFDFGIARTF
jgi:hypothetical protein